MKRWYDRYAKLAAHFESFKDMPSSRRDKLIAGIMAIIKQDHPHLLEDFLMDFPLDLFRRRWYDKDPYLWLMINGLKYADRSVIQKVVHFFDDHTRAPD